VSNPLSLGTDEATDNTLDGHAAE